MELDKDMRDAIQFFADNNFATSEIIKRGFKQRLTEGQIRAGMVRIWLRVKGGEKIKPMRLVWRAWEEARKIQSDDFMVLEDSKKTLRSKVDSLTKAKTIATTVGGIGWITALIFIVQYYWGVLWQGQ